MSTTLRNGLLVALAHVAIVASMGGKLLLDRGTYPRAWTRTVPVDPDLPIRGRYVRLRVEAPVAEAVPLSTTPRVQLRAVDGRLVALPATDGTGLRAEPATRDGEQVVQLATPVAFFIPEDVDDPSRRPPGEELWVEVTIPPTGPPRPIRLGVRRGETLTPLELR